MQCHCHSHYTLSLTETKWRPLLQTLDLAVELFSEIPCDVKMFAHLQFSTCYS